jgi:FAD:protein FMN transferase
MRSIQPKIKLKQTRILMGMPITVDIEDPAATIEIIDSVYDYFEYIDDKFSTYKDESEISLINKQLLKLEDASDDMQIVFRLAEQTRLITDGFFDIQFNGHYDPSGLVKGWAIYNASKILSDKGLENFYVDAGGDVQVTGKNSMGENWRVGIRNPFDPDQIVKVLSVTNCGVATSGTYIRGQHIYNPRSVDRSPGNEIVSLSVIGPDIFEADRFATAAFAMGFEGINFIERLQGFEGYMIDRDERATFTTGFKGYVVHD